MAQTIPLPHSEKLGGGGMGVCKGRGHPACSLCALKFLPDNVAKTTALRVSKRAQAASALNHQHLHHSRHWAKKRVKPSSRWNFWRVLREASHVGRP